MQEIWERIEAWLAINAHEILKDLQPGATNTQIKQLEALLGIELPEDFKASYLIHNGQFGNVGGLFNCNEFLSLERIQDEWQCWKDLLDASEFIDAQSYSDGSIRNNWWNSLWIPLTYDGSGNHDCLDLAPTPDGNLGQIISMEHDAANRQVLAKSYKEWLEAFANALESEMYVLSKDDGGLIDKELLS